MTFPQPRIALVLGAHGGVGGETAAALVRHGWTVRALVRDTSKARLPGITYLQGDVMDRAAVVAAAQGASIIVHAVNPPGYQGWKKRVLPMLESSIAAARASGARILLPGTIYNYDPAAHAVIDEATPQRAFTRKGKIRIEMEARLEAASAPQEKNGGVRSLILRAGDYFGPRSTGNSWFASGLVKPGQPVKTILYPGDKGVGHAWAYLPDVGETFARLADREDELPAFARFHFAGCWDADGTAMIRAVARAAGLKRPNARRLPWGLLPIAGLFSETMRELAEMQPFWRHPVRLENRKLEAFLGEELRTPLDVAVTTTMRGLDVPVAEAAPALRLARAA
uniref:NAD(P)H-binding protein n=1 Tax=uncultured Caulobacter sp. TaxID=158749 RepID=UPI0025F23EC6|nr:NAD(P)H-binding protein [uncultured Caulobacter sp.]